jgi:Flp pilus assembly protein TadD
MSTSPATARRLLRWATAVAPRFGEAHRSLLTLVGKGGDPMGAIELARRWTARFEESSDAWVALGVACRAAYRTRDALVAYERALQLEERGDVAFAAGQLYRLQGDPATAGARFARAYAAGYGPEALREIARALAAAGDTVPAELARQIWEQETGLRWEE